MISAEIIELSNRECGFDVLVILTDLNVRYNLIKLCERLNNLYNKPIKIIVDNLLIHGKDKRFRVGRFDNAPGFPNLEIGDIGIVQPKDVYELCKISSLCIKIFKLYNVETLDEDIKRMLEKDYIIV